jgi:prepilin-type N-terminal cleavage/methylation domain-containing protein
MTDAKQTERGLTLVEVAVALTILAIGLLLGIGLLAQQRKVLTRLEARQEANRALEGALEALRSGAVELNEGLTVVPVPTGTVRSAADLTVVVRASRTEPPADLFEATAEVRYRVLGEPHVRTVETLFWKPGKLKVE